MWNFRSLTSLISLVVLFGCSSNSPTSTDPKEAPPTTQIRFSEPGILNKYQAFSIAPVSFLTNDDSAGLRPYPASSTEMKGLASDFREKIIRALGSKYTQLDYPARNVAVVKISVLDVWSDSALLNLRPGSLVPNTFRGGATMEARIIDSITRKEIAYVYDSRRGTRQGFLSGLGKWDGVKNAFDEWAGLLAQATRG